MSTLIKICGMTSKAAVRASVDAGADAVGFVFFDKSPRNVSPGDAARLASGVPDHVRRVAVMLHPRAEMWDAVQRILEPDVLQTDRDDFSYLDVAEGIEIWPVVREGATPDNAPLAGTFVYEGKMSGKGQTVDWGRAAEIAKRGKMILAGGLTAGNVAKAIAEVRPFGVDVSSAVESSPGVKDEKKIRAFIDAVRNADSSNKEKAS